MRSYRFPLLFVALVFSAPAGGQPSSTQTAAAIIERAQQTLGRIQALLDSIHNRQTTARQTGNAATRDSGQSLFDGKSLGGWKATDFAGAGDVHVETSFRGGPPAIVVRFGDPMSGINWTKDVPKTNYEISLETMRVDGGDFFCGLTFPVGNSFASLIVGGWGGGVVGISSIDNSDASENETTKYRSFVNDRWYRVRLRVTPAKLEAWIDDDKIVDQNITGRRISLRPGEIYRSKPLGIATYRTSAAYRNIMLRKL